jgi:protein SCO1
MNLANTLCCLSLALGMSAPAQTVSTGWLARVAFDQHLDRQVSLGTCLTNEMGRAVKLGDSFKGRPVVLILGYYECPMLCTVVLNAFLESACNLKPSVGDQFNVISLSIDPEETPLLAAKKKAKCLTRYGRLGADQGWSFLTGDAPAIRKVADEVGFHYAYDPISRQYAHASGIVVLTPAGRVSRYFFGTEYPARELRQAIEQASAEQISSPIKQLLLLCFHYDPANSRYGALITHGVRAGAILTLVALGLGIGRMLRHERQRQSKVPNP